MLYLGDFVSGETVYFKFPTNTGTGGRVDPTVPGTMRVYRDDSNVQTTVGVDYVNGFDGTVGVSHVTVETTDSFYQSGSEFQLVLNAATIDGETVTSVPAHFSIERIPTTMKADLVAIDGQTVAGNRIGPNFQTLFQNGGVTSSLLLDQISQLKGADKRSVTNRILTSGTLTQPATTLRSLSYQKNRNSDNVEFNNDIISAGSGGVLDVRYQMAFSQGIDHDDHLGIIAEVKVTSATGTVDVQFGQIDDPPFFVKFAEVSPSDDFQTVFITEEGVTYGGGTANAEIKFVGNGLSQNDTIEVRYVAAYQRSIDATISRDTDISMNAINGIGGFHGLNSYEQEVVPLDAQGTRDSLKLAPTGGAPAANSIDDKLDNVDTDLAVVDANVDTINTTTGDTNTTVNTIDGKVDTIDTNVDGLILTTDDTNTKVTNVDSTTGDTNTKVTSMQTVTNDTNTKVTSTQTTVNDTNTKVTDVQGTVNDIDGLTSTALPNIAPNSNGGLPTLDANLNVGANQKAVLGTTLTETTPGRNSQNQSTFWDNADGVTAKIVDDVGGSGVDPLTAQETRDALAELVPSGSVNPGSIDDKLNNTEAKIDVVDGNVDTINTTTSNTNVTVNTIDGNVDSIVAKLPAGAISDFGLASLADGVSVDTILQYVMAMFNGKFTVDAGTGQITFFQRDDVTPLSVVDVLSTGRDRIT